MPEVYRVPFGETMLSFQLPDGITGQAVISDPPPALADPQAAIQAALDAPLGSPTLEQLVEATQPRSVCIAFTDASRACPDHLLVPAILARLRAAGVADDSITLLCAVGLHRDSTEAERRSKLGDAVVDGYRIIDHNARDKVGLVHIGETGEGVPLTLNRLAYSADLLIASGLVEPHQYAGYSGGAKTVSIGCGGEETIAATHGPAMLDDPRVRLGRIQDNPFQAMVRQVAQKAGLQFVLNVVQDTHHNILQVSAGAPAAVHDHLVAFARRAFEVQVPHQYDVVVAGVGPPKDANLYQASRAVTYLQLTDRPAVRRGGIIILPAPCPEGAGEGVGEQRFLSALRDAPDVETMLNTMRAHGYPPGAQRAFVVGQVLSEVEVIVVGARDAQVVRDCKMTPAQTMEEALAMAKNRLGVGLKALIVPYALQTLVRVAVER
ncbi:MAG: nickel-dependent lactate racemase [Anaerolineae bacterium]